MSLSRSLGCMVFVLVLGACQGMPAATLSASVDSAAAIPGSSPDDNLNAVVWQQTSEEYRLIAIGTWRAATRQLERALTDSRWDALTREDRDTPIRGLPPAVIVDVDETVLDNSPYQARLIRDHRAYDAYSWASWAREEAATAVPGALEFTRAAADRGITVYYISNRSQDLDAATFDNLRKLGFPIADRSQFLGLGVILDGCEEIGTEKGCRRRSVGRHHRVLLQVGDQLVDMVTVLANTTEGRRQAVTPYLHWVGERWFVLPNATYGSWEPALFNNDWTQSDAERRRQKIEALRY